MEFSNFDILKYPLISVKKGYKEWVETYEDTVQDEMDIRLLSKIRIINWSKINTSIDLACGTGRIAVWLKNQGVKKIDGVDFTLEMLNEAKEKNVYHKLYNRDILDTQLENENYDLAIEVLADEHLADLYPLYLEASRIIKKGGYFVIVGYHSHFLMNGLITHFHRKTGEPIAIKSYVHLFSDHVKAALATNLSLQEMEEGIIDNDWIEKKPKWKKYLNRPISFSMVWQKKS